MGEKLAKHSALIFLCLFFDQVTKNFALTANMAFSNPGMMFGLYKDLPAGVRVVMLCSMFGFLFLIYLTLNYLLSEKLQRLKYGLTFLIGGILGNVIDRSLYAHAIDFIPIPLGANATLYFNLADVFQWAGFGLILFEFYRNGKTIWYPENSRNRLLIRPKEQLRFALKFSAIAFSCSVMLGLFSISFIRIGLDPLPQKLLDPFVMAYIITYAALALAFSLCVFFAGILISHRSHGPLYAFERHVEDLIDGNQKTLVLREGDQHRHLMDVAKKLDQLVEKDKAS